MKQRRIYISGPISNTPDFIKKFEVIEAGLRLKGLDVINPAKIGAQLPTLKHYEYMSICIAMLKMCTDIYMMDGWENSKGARMEIDYAKKHNKRITYQNN